MRGTTRPPSSSATKTKKNPVLAALRCLTLQRMRRLSEAAEACNDLVTKGYTDENVLAPLTMCLNALNRDGEATTLWANISRSLVMRR